MNYLKIIFLSGIFLTACEAPHSNPFDPENPHYSYGQISGSVRTISPPVEGIPQTLVYWPSANQYSQTDVQGKFELLTASIADGWLILTHPEFRTDSVFIQWPAEKTLNFDIYLNALPRLDSLAVYSIVLNRFPALQKEQLMVEAKITDRDNDIDSVKTRFAEQIKKFYLPYNTTSKFYQREFSILDLAVPKLEEMVGQPVQLTVKDVYSHLTTVGQGQLIRVIHEEIAIVSPRGDSVTSARPTLIWEPFTVEFQFHYNLEIYTNELAPQLVWSKQGLDQTETSSSVETDLPEGGFFWVIWAVDSFGNRTRSEPAAFRVQGGS